MDYLGCAVCSRGKLCCNNDWPNLSRSSSADFCCCVIGCSADCVATGAGTAAIPCCGRIPGVKRKRPLSRILAQSMPLHPTKVYWISTLNICDLWGYMYIKAVLCDRLNFSRRKQKTIIFWRTNVVFLPVTKDGAGTGRMVVRPGCCCCWAFNRGADVFPGGGAASGGMLLGCEKFTPTAGFAPPIAPVPPA